MKFENFGFESFSSSPVQIKKNLKKAAENREIFDLRIKVTNDYSTVKMIFLKLIGTIITNHT